MKHKTLVCLALAMMLIAACASAQQLPSVNCFSPGLLKVNGLENSAVSIDAALTVENAMYARNLSVLQAMLDGTNFRVQADGKTGTLSIGARWRNADAGRRDDGRAGSACQFGWSGLQRGDAGRGGAG